MKKKAFNYLLIIITFFSSVSYLFSSAIPLMQGVNFWLLSFLALAFPYSFLLQFLIGIVWLFVHKKRALFVFLILVPGLQQITSVFSFKFSSIENSATEPNVIRILSWNVSRWDERNKKKRGGVSFRPLMLDYIKIQNADILCFQEFFECIAPEYFEENIPEIKKMGYPYVYFTPSSKLFENKFQYGLCIFSRFPITDSGFMNPVPGIHSEGISFADIALENSTIRIFNSHLESPGLTKNDFNNDGTAKVSGTTVAKIKNAYDLRYKQAEYLNNAVKESPYPVVLCLDMNDVPTSNIYYKVRNNLCDAFLEKGTGIGKTYRFLSPFMRIDYLFTDPSLSLLTAEIGQCTYSDHFPVLVSFSEKTQ